MSSSIALRTRSDCGVEWFCFELVFILSNNASGISDNGVTARSTSPLAESWPLTSGELLTPRTEDQCPFF